jgi:hypothetical protein
MRAEAAIAKEKQDEVLPEDALVVEPVSEPKIEHE